MAWNNSKVGKGNTKKNDTKLNLCGKNSLFFMHVVCNFYLKIHRTHDTQNKNKGKQVTIII